MDLLPTLKSPVQVASISSYDRSGGNDDGFSGKYSFVRREPEGLVLADLEGPGVIYRLWTPTPSDDVLEFFFDGEAAPRLQVQFRELFLGEHPAFPRPLVGYGVGGFYSYVPLPYARSCKVRLRAERTQFYQINYATYAPETPVKSFTLPLTPEDQARHETIRRLWAQPGADLSAAVAPPGASLQVQRTNLTVAPNQTAMLFRREQPGRLVGLRLSPASALAGKARDLRLRMTFDGEVPAVDCPAGDFFGYGWGQPAMQSLLLGTVGGTNYCYFPMPFKRAATIEFVSERDGAVALSAEAVWAASPQTEREGKFYAYWRRENPTTAGRPFTFIDFAGRGHLVGSILQAQGLESGKTLFFEGDDQTTLDGQLVIHGTGSEDFFNGGWYDVPDRWEKRLSFPLSGCLDYAKHLGRTGGYRLFLGDAYHFREHLTHVIEHAGTENNIPTDYCAVTLFYAAQPPALSLTPPPVAERAVVDLQEIVFPAWWQIPIHAFCFQNAALTRQVEKINNEEVRSLAFTASGPDWFGPPFLSLICDLPSAGRYEILIETVRGPAQGQVRLFQNEIPVAPAVDLYAETRSKSGRRSLGQLELAEGKNPLMLKLVGKNERATGLGLDLIQVVCIRRP